MVAFNRKTEGVKQVSTHLSPRGNRTNSGQVHSVWVGVSAPQNAPTSLSATPANTSVSIAFTPPTDNGGMDINNYQYAISSNGGSTYSAYAALSPADGVSPITVTGLTQNTAYLIKLKAVNDVGVSDVESSPVSFTSQGVPTSAPSSLSSIQTNNSVAISFTAAASSTALTNYEYSFNNSTWTALSPADAVSPVTISGLSENTAYNVYLRGVNSYGSGPGSTATSFTTFGPPTGTATITSITSVTQTTATVNFTVAAGGGAITGYDLYVANFTNAWNNTTASPISVTGLTANTTYTFYVRAKNAYGVGPQSAGVNATTLRNPISATVLVVAGGGGGAGSSYPNAGGGGGGGGAIQQASTFTAGTYAVAVGGAGSAGAGSNSSSGGTGGTSSINGVSRSGGGGGSGTQTGGASGNGFAGGTGSSAGAGGGGASAVGGNGVGGNPSSPGNGGAGISTSLRTGSNENLAGGGGGSVQNQTSIVSGTGLGVFGGGNGLQFNIGPGSAANNYGGGGGGGNGTSQGGAGFQGIVVVRYATSAATGYTISGGTVTTVGADTVRTFTAGGNLVIS